MRAFAFLIALLAAGPVLAAGTPATSPAPASSPAAAEGTATDRIVASTPVPDAARKVGDTRLVSRGDAVVVQTLLSTKLLSRVVAEIRIKEERNWPDGQPGADARRAYVDALTSARDLLDKRVPAGPGWTDRRQRLLIEFAADPLHASFTIGTFEELPLPDQPGPTQREVFTSQEAARDYVLRNIRLIVADSFHVDEKDAGRIGPLVPAAAPAPPAAAPAPAAPPVKGPRH